MKLHDFANLFTAYKRKITLEMSAAKLVPCKQLFSWEKKKKERRMEGRKKYFSNKTMCVIQMIMILKVKSQNIELNMWPPSLYSQENQQYYKKKTSLLRDKV